MLERELYLIATDLDTTERVVLGEGEWAEVPISEAVAASGALPGIYEPVEINGREFIDGGILSTTNVDVAIERGAKFVVVINPLVPYVNDFAKDIPTITGSRARRVSDMGIVAIAQPDLPPALPRPPAPRGRDLGGALPRRRHHPDRARARRRAHVRHLDPRLPRPAADRQARVRVGDPEARPRLRPLQGRSPSATGSRSRPAGCATCSTRSSASARSSRPGAGCSSSPTRRCCAPRAGRGGRRRGRAARRGGLGQTSPGASGRSGRASAG